MQSVGGARVLPLCVHAPINMVATSVEKLASAIDSASNNKWDFVTRTAYGAFERQVRNSLNQVDLGAVLDNDEPTLEDVR